MGILSRVTARQRLRRATQESLTVPPFNAPPDCAPWVIGGLWPVALSHRSIETESLASYLKADLHRIAHSANEDLRAIGRAGMTYSARRQAEARVIEEARALAVRRVESTLRQVRQANGRTPTDHSARQPRESSNAPRPDLAKTEISSQNRSFGVCCIQGDIY